MKITLFLSFFCALQLLATSSNAQNALIKLQSETITIGELIKEIEKQTEYLVVFSHREIDTEKTVKLKSKSGKASDLFNDIFDKSNIRYIFEKDYIILTNNNLNDRIKQSRVISGTVKDINGDPIVGASITIMGTTEGTMTDVNGYFSLSFTEGTIFKVSFIGYLEQQITISDKSRFDIVLQENEKTLDEVVVIGYGTTKRKDLTGAVSSLSAKHITEVTVTNPQLALQGRVPGVQVTQTDFSPSGGLNIRIRGTRSFQATNDPLYVVDGMMMTTGLGFLNPDDIESMDILKDASATAIYGSRGANGVVIITTKRGKEGKPQVDYNGYIGIQHIGRKLDMMNAPEWIEYMREAHRQAKGNLQYNSPVPNMEDDKKVVRFSEDPYVLRTVMMGWNEDGSYWDPNKVQGYDWLDAVTQTGYTSNHNLNIHGGTKKTQYAFGTSFSNTDGVVKNRVFDRITARSAIDTEFSNIFKGGVTFQYAHTKEQLETGLYSNASKMWPASVPFDDAGSYIDLPGNDATNYNVLYDLVDGAVNNQRKRDRILANAYLEARIFKDLTFRSSFSYDYDMYVDGNFRASKTRANIGGDNTASVTNRRAYSYTLDNMFTYSKKINNNHNLVVTLAQSIQSAQEETSLISAKGIPIDSQLWYNLGSVNEITKVGSSFSEKKLASFLGRAQYNLKDRYLLTASLRYDGASVLAEGRKWVAFPSAALAWRVMEESFMSTSKEWLSNLKVRVGWGRTGNSSVNPYQTQGGLSNTKYVFGESRNVIGFSPTALANKELGWEYTNQTNLGLDFGFFNSRITGTVDLYLQETEALLMNRQLPVALGYESILYNIGKTQNKGFELGINTININSKSGLYWTTDWVFYMNKEKIVELYNGKTDDVGNAWFIGHPIDVWYGYKQHGIWQNTPDDIALMAKWNAAGSTRYVPGTIRLVDRNGDNAITANEDRMIVGNPRPKFIASVMNNFSYKGFDMSFFLYADYGRMIKNNADMAFNGRANQPKYDYWTPNNPSNKYPQPYRDSESATSGSDFMTTLRYEDGSFLRMREITLGYTLPKQITRKAFLEKFRVYCSVQNPFTITSFTGVDPEAAHGSDYPMVRTFIFGWNLSF